MKLRHLIAAALLLLFVLPLLAEDWITIYNDDLSLVRSRFTLELKQGRQNYNFDDITSRIMPNSVIVKGSGIRVAEQNYEYDLAGKHQIMAKYLDKEVMAVMKDQSRLQGTLKFFDGSNLGIIENGTQRLLVIADSEVQWIQLASLPTNFYTKPTLAWNLIAARSGKHSITMTYLSGGFSWDVAYNAVWNGTRLDLNSWVTINNRSGKAFEDVNLKLIAGDINQIRNQYLRAGRGYEDGIMMESMADKAPSFEEKAFHDFKMYTLDQKVSFANNQTKQLELYPPQAVMAQSVYEFRTFGRGVQSLIKFVNTEDQGLGKPLPKGVIKVYKADDDGNLEFIGEDRINHTSRNEEVSITTGTTFDLVASSSVRNQKTISQRASQREIHVHVKNNSSERKSINVLHQLSGNARVSFTELRYAYDELKNTVTFTVNLDPDQEQSFFFRELSEW
ncbi:MAG: DUF4139 domain-containing protein [Candidatus Cloacimonadaceae bacterium]|jgi:hypothetical protein|nr:DUF4139 domain-containing protein [Candidatus Cloacimonadota bacterium]MDY0128132.1 DUF4139 domain-containing protein [Candidatus Cloacimonadaceae bacterium]MCB5254312.1 DUF4139 domain-containing protein [Candidatus Cloacimonadota bacterium]MCK9178492.1 DUF4139 domain-containing protein [Candidatus Cloacimonadota bacterium]MCK9243544.1 DUF4139 domain-containing protein [Candidatus Cloacimonadota bacterium]